MNILSAIELYTWKWFKWSILCYIYLTTIKKIKEKKESCIKIPYNLEYRNEEEDAHVREKVEEESVILINRRKFKELRNIQRYEK